MEHQKIQARGGTGAHRIGVAALTLAALAVAIAIMPGTAAHAQERRIVSTRGYDLSDPADLRRVKRRIEWAVIAVCQPVSPGLHGVMLAQRCRHAARMSASAQLASLLDKDLPRAGARRVANAAIPHAGTDS